MAITLLRHGAVPLKYQKRYISNSNIDLDINLFAKEKVLEIKNKKFDIVYSSDLSRCTNTLRQLDKKFLKDMRLREVRFKQKIELKTFTEIEELECFHKKHLMSSQTWYNYICQESLKECRIRLKYFTRSLDYKQDILICSHNGILKVLDSLLKDTDYFKSNFNLDYLDYLVIPRQDIKILNA